MLPSTPSMHSAPSPPSMTPRTPPLPTVTPATTCDNVRHAADVALCWPSPGATYRSPGPTSIGHHTCAHPNMPQLYPCHPDARRLTMTRLAHQRPPVAHRSSPNGATHGRTHASCAPGQPNVPQCVLHIRPHHALSLVYRVCLVPVAPAIHPRMCPTPTLAVIHACPCNTSACFGPDQHIPATPMCCAPFPIHLCITAPLSRTLQGSYRPLKPWFHLPQPQPAAMALCTRAAPTSPGMPRPLGIHPPPEDVPPAHLSCAPPCRRAPCVLDMPLPSPDMAPLAGPLP